ncbi:Flp pilus assembly protein CpaB [Oceanibacterium hippocampi]|uniref:SAF domain protein n=1 Tax=Oceanibacterium hippocampi TaxID=745714 RepID=A0A1Y5SFI1_9PROT|nr:Flp pilus assembly protein CpaB [Oceanibacterium hippocampi]SLN36491.1 SAF domain protein [Oceanibacterium hippocampi]
MVRKLILLVFALIIVGGGVQVARLTLFKKAPAPSGPVAAPVKEINTQVLVAAKQLPIGVLLRDEHMRWQDWPEDAEIPDIYVVNKRRKMDEFLGTVVRRNVVAGEPITDQHVVKPGQSGFLAAALEPGMRAVSVPINATTGIAGFVFPGDRVDLILTQGFETPDDPDRVSRLASETILSDLRVLAMDQKTDENVEEPEVARVVTLEVSPEGAEVIAVAADLGRLSLSLRSLRREEIEGPTLASAADGTAVAPVAGDDALRQIAPGLRPQKERKRTFTRDSDASQVLNPPTTKDAQIRKVQVVRANELKEEEFKRGAR